MISNDDGVHAPGLHCLATALAEQFEIRVVAPDRNRSGASNSLTLDRPLELETLANGFISVNGTPTDCVHLGASGLLDFLPEMVVAGINSGANLGDDVLYSGTVAAAMEGRYLSKPAIAIGRAELLPYCGDRGEPVATAAGGAESGAKNGAQYQRPGSAVGSN